MILLVVLIHGIFATIFFIFGRYIESSILGLFLLFFFIKIIPPIDVFKKPQFLKKEVSGKESLYQSLHLSSGVLFYLALVGLSISASEYFDISNNLRLFQYCVFFLSSIMYALYLMFSTKSPGIVLIFRIHCIITGIFLIILSFALVFFEKSDMGFMLLNTVFILSGLMAVLVLDTHIPRTSYIVALYTFLGLVFAGGAVFVSTIAFLTPHSFIYTILLSIFLLAGLYLFLPQMLRRSRAIHHISYAVWHMRNTLLLVSWALLAVLLMFLFGGQMDTRNMSIFGLLVLLLFWSWVYVHTERSPVFFSGNILVLTALYAYVFFYILPPTFWVLLVCLFIFVGILLLFARYFYGKNEELILAIDAVLFICIVDFYCIFLGQYGLFLLSSLFFLQSFLWYGVYEIFHRHSHAKIAPL